MTAPAVFWPVLLGVLFLVAGMISYRRDVHVASSREGVGLLALGPAFVGASLAAFAGEHFTAAPTIAAIVPKWLPVPLFIAYFVGAAHLAAATSFVAKRLVRWAALCLALMFALFVLLMDLPGAIGHPAVRINWSLAARETTFAIGALALFATEARTRWPGSSKVIVAIARFWTAFVLVFYGIENVMYPQYSPGVPDLVPVPSWIPLPIVVAWVTGLLLIAFGLAMFLERYAAGAAAASGWLMVVLTVTMYVPQLFIARDVSAHVRALNFIFDTLLFGGMMLVVGNAIWGARTSVTDVAIDAWQRGARGPT